MANGSSHETKIEKEIAMIVPTMDTGFVMPEQVYVLGLAFPRKDILRVKLVVCSKLYAGDASKFVAGENKFGELSVRLLKPNCGDVCVRNERVTGSSPALQRFVGMRTTVFHPRHHKGRVFLVVWKAKPHLSIITNTTNSTFTKDLTRMMVGFEMLFL